MCGSWDGDGGIRFVECDGVTLYGWTSVVPGGICGTSIVVVHFLESITYRNHFLQSPFPAEYIYGKEDVGLQISEHVSARNGISTAIFRTVVT